MWWILGICFKVWIIGFLVALMLFVLNNKNINWEGYKDWHAVGAAFFWPLVYPVAFWKEFMK